MNTAEAVNRRSRRCQSRSRTSSAGSCHAGILRAPSRGPSRAPTKAVRAPSRAIRQASSRALHRAFRRVPTKVPSLGANRVLRRAIVQLPK